MKKQTDNPQPEIKPVSVQLKNGPVPQDNPKFRSPSRSVAIGIYSGQLATYIKMLEAGHPGRKKVKDALIYYVVMGVVIRFDFC